MENSLASQSRFNVYNAVTAKIVQAILKGAGTFVMPWHGGSPSNSLPVNVSSKAPYRGVNVLVLWAEAFVKGYASGNWASYRQWQELGAQVRQGERATTVVFFKECAPVESDPNDTPDQKARWRIARSFNVFNSAQVDGWAAAPSNELPEFFGSSSADTFVEATKAVVRHGREVARYLVREDVIEIPDWKLFWGTPTSTSRECYYAVLLHELTHWSGAPHRLNRELGRRFGDQAYAMEELVAELGAAFLCATLGIANEPRQDHAAYVASWLEVLNRDPKAVFTAAAQAQKAVEYLAGLAKSNRWPETSDQTSVGNC
jgi:antirestriction protein ArdC